VNDAGGGQGFVFRDELRPTLSQGDLIGQVPWGIFPDPLVLCRPARSGTGKESIPWADPWPSQQKPFAKGIEEVHFSAQVSQGVVLWDDCQIDKLGNSGRPKEKWFAAVAPVLPAKLLQKGSVPAMEGQVRRYFPLAKDDKSGVLDDSYIDLRHIIPIRYSLLEARRVASMTDVGRAALMAHLFTFLTSMKVPDACTNCGSPVALKSAGDD
jgi:hypothetical protein